MENQCIAVVLVGEEGINTESVMGVLESPHQQSTGVNYVDLLQLQGPSQDPDLDPAPITTPVSIMASDSTDSGSGPFGGLKKLYLKWRSDSTLFLLHSLFAFSIFFLGIATIFYIYHMWRFVMNFEELHVRYDSRKNYGTFRHFSYYVVNMIVALETLLAFSLIYCVKKTMEGWLNTDMLRDAKEDIRWIFLTSSSLLVGMVFWYTQSFVTHYRYGINVHMEVILRDNIQLIETTAIRCLTND